MTWTLALCSLAGACSSIMDTIAHHYDKSIFKRGAYNPYPGINKYRYLFWTPEGWRNKYNYANEFLGRRKLYPSAPGLLGRINYPVQLTDAWHLFKTINIAAYCLAIVLYKPWLGMWDLLICGITVNTTFSLFYNHILIKKK